jgi:hypothetical protein
MKIQKLFEAKRATKLLPRIQMYSASQGGFEAVLPHFLLPE